MGEIGEERREQGREKEREKGEERKSEFFKRGKVSKNNS